MAHVFLALLLGALQTPRPEPRSSKWTGITLDYEYWMAGVAGSTESGHPAADPDGSLNFSDDLRVRSGSMMTFGLQVAWPADRDWPGELAVRLEYQRGTWTGRGTLQEGLTFDDEPFLSGTSVSSRLRFDNFRFEMVGTVGLDRAGVFQLLFGGGMGVMHGTQRLAAAATRAESVVGVDFQVGVEVGAKVQPWRFAHAQAIVEFY